jgi:DNA-binding MarR family transcriptional regulator
MLKVLEKHRLVSIGPNPTDGRSKTVTATEAAHTLLMETRMAMAPDMARFVAQVSPDTIAKLVPDLSKIGETMDRARD